MTVPPTGLLRRALRAGVDGLPAPFWWLWLGTLVNRAGGFVQPFLVLYLTGPRGLSVPESGVVLAAYGVGVLGSQPVGGVLADRVGRRATMVGGLATTGVMLGLLGAARGFGLIAAAALALGAVSDVYRPAATAVIADLLPEPVRPRAFALQFWAINLGFSVAGVVGGILAAHGYTVLFVVDDPADLRVRRALPPGLQRAAALHPRRRPLDRHLRRRHRGERRGHRGAATVAAAAVRPDPPHRAAAGEHAAGGRRDRPHRPGLDHAVAGRDGAGLERRRDRVQRFDPGDGHHARPGAPARSVRRRHRCAWGGSVLLGPLVGTAVHAGHPAFVWWGCLVLGGIGAVGYVFLGRAVARRGVTAVAGAAAVPG